jgi:flagellar hook-basal body complex protein FliE
MEAIQNLSLAVTPVQPKLSATAQAETSFGEILKTLTAETDQQQQGADQAIQQLQAGGEKNLHETMISMEKADISLRYMVQVRNKAIDAYQEIMRMQV